MPVKIFRLLQMRLQIFCIENANHFIKTCFINWQPGIMKLFHLFKKIMQWKAVFNAAYIKPGTHDLLNRNVSEFDNTF